MIRSGKQPGDPVPAGKETPVPDSALAMAETVSRSTEHEREAAYLLGRARGKFDLPAALRDVAALAPADGIASRLTALLVATVEAAIDEHALASLAGKAGGLRDHRLRALTMSDKLARTAVLIAEALDRHRRPPEQVVRVEHVHVHPGGQAIVGTVGHPGEGGNSGNGRQSHAPGGGASEPGASVPGEVEAERATMPGAGGKEQDGMPDARGQGRRAGGPGERRVEARHEVRRARGGTHDAADLGTARAARTGRALTPHGRAGPPDPAPRPAGRGRIAPFPTLLRMGR